MSEIVLGFAILLLGAMCGGSFGLPSKFVSKNLPWENLWGPFFLFATLLLPLFIGPSLVPGLFGIYLKTGFYGLVLPFMFGVLWGLGSMTLGLSFAFIGLSLAYALNYGGQIIVGFLVPTMIHDPNHFATTAGMVNICGVIICLAGVIVCGRAGMLKSANEENNSSATDKPKKSALPGLFLAVMSGVLCGCWSVAFSFAGGINQAAENANILDWRNSLPATFLILFGGFFSSCLYCVMKLQQNKTWNKFLSINAFIAIIIALFMAILHDAAVACFGFGASKTGVAVGYVVFMAFAIIVGNFNGFLMGEWKRAGKKAVKWITAGIVVLVIAVCILGIGQGMNAKPAASQESQETTESNEIKDIKETKETKELKETTKTEKEPPITASDVVPD
ncbi:MAG: L-rhamnose/proton symporter RhaT [Thermoguttaceae bacterium]